MIDSISAFHFTDRSRAGDAQQTASHHAVANAIHGLFRAAAIAVIATKTALLPAGSRGGVDSSMLHREFMGEEWREQVTRR